MQIILQNYKIFSKLIFYSKEKPSRARLAQSPKIWGLPFSISETPLTLATTLKKPSKVIIALVNGGALLDYRTKEGLTAMHRAVERNSLEAVKTLLELGASPNYKDTKGLTPLYYSVIYKTDPMLCETLLHDHATIGAQDLQGWQEVHQVSLISFRRCFSLDGKQSFVKISKN